MWLGAELWLGAESGNLLVSVLKCFTVCYMGLWGGAQREPGVYIPFQCVAVKPHVEGHAATCPVFIRWDCLGFGEGGVVITI